MIFTKGHKKIGGRAKGSQNRVKRELVDKIHFFINTNIDTIQADFDQLEPLDRIKVYIALLNYVLPKKQALNVNEQVHQEYKELEQMLDKTPQTYIDRISERITKLHDDHDDQD